MVAEYVNGKLDREFVWGDDPDDLIQIKRDSNGDGAVDQTLYPVDDELNTVHALTDENGNVVERYRYESDGKMQVEAPDFSQRSYSLFGNTIGWQGRPWFGSYGYFRNRWLDTDSHSWMSPDPAHYPDNVANAYAPFGRDGGINKNDPEGLYYLVSARGAPRTPLVWTKPVDGDGRVYSSLAKFNNVTIFIHGFNVDEEHSRHWTNDIENRLISQPGEKYVGSLIGLDWAGDTGEFGGEASGGLDSALNFVGNIHDARVAGSSLALLIRQIRTHVPSARINLLSHSLGAEVLLAGLQVLHDEGAQVPFVSTAIMMQAAVPAAYLISRPVFTGRNPTAGPLYEDFDSYIGRYADAPLWCRQTVLSISTRHPTML